MASQEPAIPPSPKGDGPLAGLLWPVDEATFRRLAREYLACLDGQDLVARSFGWSGRFLLPFVYHDGTMVREVCATVAARTWREAGVKVALWDLKQPSERRVTDVMVRQGSVVALAWDRRGRSYALESESLLRRDEEEDAPAIPRAPA